MHDARSSQTEMSTYSASATSTSSESTGSRVDDFRGRGHAELQQLQLITSAGAAAGGGGVSGVRPNLGKLAEGVLALTPSQLRCPVLCGGMRCKFESAAAWTSEQMAVDGIYSHWVTDDLLAMSRPNTSVIEQKDIIGQFHSLGIKTIMNLQVPGEHAGCARLEKSGFTYDPDLFMSNNIFFYNFGWKDYGEPSLSSLLDIVKVVAFAVCQGKVAVHCHAGIGRTGVVLACFLVYSLRVKANDAIRYVRLRRPNAVQTRGQILAVQEFEQFLLPHMAVFSNRSWLNERDKKSDYHEFTLSQCLVRQKHILHGFEARALRYIPKLLYVVCERIVALCDATSSSSPSLAGDRCAGGSWSSLSCSQHERPVNYRLGSPSFTAFFISARISSGVSCGGSVGGGGDVVTGDTGSRSSMSASFTTDEQGECDTSQASSTVDDSSLDSLLDDGIRNEQLLQNDVYGEIQSSLRFDQSQGNIKVSAGDIYDALMAEHAISSDEARKLLRHYRLQLNRRHSSWCGLAAENNIHLLTGLLFEWLEHLRHPVIDTNCLTHIVTTSSNVEFCLKKLDKGSRFTLEYLVRFTCRIQPLTPEQQTHILRRIQAALTHQAVPIEGVLKPAGKGYSKMREGTLQCMNQFMDRFRQMVLNDADHTAGRTINAD